MEGNNKLVMILVYEFQSHVWIFIEFIEKGGAFILNKTNQKTLKDEEIVNIVIKYIDENLYNYAILIDGEWGCGKTYFVKKYLIGKIEDHEKNKEKEDESYKSKKIVYISLYGVKSADDVSKQIFMESYLAKTGKAKNVLRKGAEVAGKLLPVAFDVMTSFTGVKADNDKVLGVINDFLTIKKSILIFDDLERCDCPINEMLGYINGFVEHEELKVILVANQKEIGKESYIKNMELKYLVAANQNIDFESKSESQRILDIYTQENKQDKQMAQPVSIDMIENRINRLFGQDVMYERIKEKLVGITIYYQPDLQRIFNKFIKNDNFDDALQSQLKENISFFEECMIRENHSNLRTFQFFLSKINDLNKSICKIEGDGKDIFLNHIIQYCFKICVAYKKDSLKYTWEENEEYAFKSVGQSDIFGNRLAFRFVDDFVLKSILDNQKVIKMFEIFENEYIQKSDAFRELDTKWYILEDSDVQQKMQQVIEDLGNDIYEFKEYQRIIGRFVELEQIGFPEENTNVVIEKMKENIFKSGQHINIDNGYGLLQEGNKKQRYKEIIDQLQKEIDQNFKEHISNTIEDYLSLETEWGECLEKYVYSNKTEIYQSSGFLKQMSLSVLCEKIKNSNSKDIDAFRECIITLYVRGIMGDGLKKDEGVLRELSDEIQKMHTDDFDRIKKMQVKYLIKNLQSAIEMFEN